MSLLNGALFHGSLSSSGEVTEENHMGKTETDDATHDLRILSFKKIFQPAQHSKLRVNELANKLS